MASHRHRRAVAHGAAGAGRLAGAAEVRVAPAALARHCRAARAAASRLAQFCPASAFATLAGCERFRDAADGSRRGRSQLASIATASAAPAALHVEHVFMRCLLVCTRFSLALSRIFVHPACVRGVRVRLCGRSPV